MRNERKYDRSWSASKETDTVYLVDLERHCALRGHSTKSDIEFIQLPLTFGPIKDSNRWTVSGIGQSGECCRPSGEGKLQVCLQTLQKLQQLGWYVKVHPPYSPELETWDYHLFWPLQNSLNWENFNFLKVCKNQLVQFVIQKYAEFCKDG